MNKLSLSVCLAFTFFGASAVAQIAPGGALGTQNSSPTTSDPSQYRSQKPGQTSADQNATTQNQANAEQTIKGCVRSQSGSYFLETKQGKEIALAGQDVSGHVGQEVALKGIWKGGHATSSTYSVPTTTANAQRESPHELKVLHTFNVSSVKMISESCNSGL
jgi:hypothetical protein